MYLLYITSITLQLQLLAFPTNGKIPLHEKPERLRNKYNYDTCKIWTDMRLFLLLFLGFSRGVRSSTCSPISSCCVTTSGCSVRASIYTQSSWGSSAPEGSSLLLVMWPDGVYYAWFLDEIFILHLALIGYIGIIHLFRKYIINILFITGNIMSQFSKEFIIRISEWAPWSMVIGRFINTCMFFTTVELF